ncbi:hypothetical protein HYPSUDRAFT_136304 [Hypholoma sublateritium FD-334 SS-4]|uniref:RTA1 like protein n=1 Tax=Hypholoma sublateritium (strain FD-334 SS-4) TaxID=945553 RepID=A0A0D2PY52_HYPSF|nr:hypothetical protein HYPSUDRAFT_136304 [Hypholoma sublateritium FD-334 SS-4]
MPYHYIPTEWVAILFIVLYSITTILHIGQATFYRMWWLLPTVCLCGLLEIIGWSARLWSSFSPFFSTPFEIQITATILGPTPFLAANFVIFGALIRRLGTQYSRLSPRMYTILFCTCDVISLIVQAIGGGKAAVASGNGLNPALGGHIMLGGISFQLLTITLYAMCATEFYVRYAADWPLRKGPTDVEPTNTTPGGEVLTKRTTLMTAGLIFSTTLLFIRQVLRKYSNLSDGWAGRIIKTQRLFNWLDGGMITLAMYSANAAHPGRLLGRRMGLDRIAPTAASSDTGSEKERLPA